jgi:hypothetical protein
MGERRYPYRVSVPKPDGENCLEDPDVDEKILK